MRIAACFAVVSIHAVGLNQGLLTQGYQLNWWLQNITVSFSAWAVPIFVMISGALIFSAEKKESDSKFFIARIFRILPSFIWIFFYFIFYHFYRGDYLDAVAIIGRLVLGPLDHLYFLPIILGLYCIAVIFRKILRKLSLNEVACLAMLFFYIGIFWKVSRLTLTMFVPYIGYFILGYYLHLISLPTKYRWHIRVSFLLTSLGILVLTYLSTMQNEVAYKNNTIFYAHLHPILILQSICIFLLFKQSKRCNELYRKNDWVTKTISRATLGIYVIHPFIQLTSFIVLKEYMHFSVIPWYVMLLFIPYSFVASYVVTRLFQNLPLLRHTV